MIVEVVLDEQGLVFETVLLGFDAAGTLGRLHSVMSDGTSDMSTDVVALDSCRPVRTVRAYRRHTMRGDFKKSDQTSDKY